MLYRVARYQLKDLSSKSRSLEPWTLLCQSPKDMFLWLQREPGNRALFSSDTKNWKRTQWLHSLMFHFGIWGIETQKNLPSRISLQLEKGDMIGLMLVGRGFWPYLSFILPAWNPDTVAGAPAANFLPWEILEDEKPCDKDGSLER